MRGDDNKKTERHKDSGYRRDNKNVMSDGYKKSQERSQRFETAAYTDKNENRKKWNDKHDRTTKGKPHWQRKSYEGETNQYTPSFKHGLSNNVTQHSDEDRNRPKNLTSNDPSTQDDTHQEYNDYLDNKAMTSNLRQRTSKQNKQHSNISEESLRKKEKNPRLSRRNLEMVNDIMTGFMNPGAAKKSTNTKVRI